MILVVEALDANGKPLALRQGPVNPAYSGNYGGLPGKTFAKVLRDEWTGETPTASLLAAGQHRGRYAPGGYGDRYQALLL